MIGILGGMKKNARTALSSMTVKVEVSEWEAVNMVAFALQRGAILGGESTIRRAISESIALYGACATVEENLELLEKAKGILSKLYEYRKRKSAARTGN